MLGPGANAAAIRHEYRSGRVGGVSLSVEFNGYRATLEYVLSRLSARGAAAAIYASSQRGHEFPVGCGRCDRALARPAGLPGDVMGWRALTSRGRAAVWTPACLELRLLLRRTSHASQIDPRRPGRPLKTCWPSATSRPSMADIEARQEQSKVVLELMRAAEPEVLRAAVREGILAPKSEVDVKG